MDAGHGANPGHRYDIGALRQPKIKISQLVPKVDRALAFAQQVIDSGALYFRRNPAVGERLKEVAGQNRNYLAHEYFNEDWRKVPR